VCRASHVRTRNTTSCGQGNCHPAYRHGESGVRNPRRKEYRALCHALSQCYNKNDQYYPRVGAKGIKVCARWRRSFQNFLADVGPCPIGKQFLQRIDRNKDFKRGNVRWADSLEIGCNKEKNRWVTLDGITLHLSEWSRVTGMDRGTIEDRLSKGWSAVEALTTPPRQRRDDYQCQWRQDRARLIALAKRNFQNPKLTLRKP